MLLGRLHDRRAERRARRKDAKYGSSQHDDELSEEEHPNVAPAPEGESRSSKHRSKSRHRHHEKHHTRPLVDEAPSVAYQHPHPTGVPQPSRDPNYGYGAPVPTGRVPPGPPPPYTSMPPQMPVTSLPYRPAVPHANTMPIIPASNHSVGPPVAGPPPPVPTRSRTASSAALVTGGLWSAGNTLYNIGTGLIAQAPGPIYELGSASLDSARRGLDDVITAIDGQVFGGGVAYSNPLLPAYAPGAPLATAAIPSSTPDAISRGQVTGGIGGAVMGQFSKVWAYSNSRLPPYLPPCKLYIATYPLLCLAAQYSLSAYAKPTGKEKEDHISASMLSGTKPMILKSLPRDDMNTVVFAIRGSGSFTDWAVNFRTAPTPPTDFLDDEGNLCHSGFLSVAKSMAKSVCERIKTMLQEDPSRNAASLLITGHSAGGAVAQLLYAHMLSETVDSELAQLAHFFKRVHCVTFGAPPVSLLPLKTPEGKRNKNSVFLAFANEGDPVVRADRAVIIGLLKLLASGSPPKVTPPAATLPQATQPAESGGGFWSRPAALLKAATEPILGSSAAAATQAPAYPIPPSTLALGGRLVLLRPKVAALNKNDVEACQIDNEMLQDVVYGDPVVHMMDLYAQRIEYLATKALTAGGVAA